jgi:hypothetical protein
MIEIRKDKDKTSGADYRIFVMAEKVVQEIGWVATKKNRAAKVVADAPSKDVFFMLYPGQEIFLNSVKQALRKKFKDCCLYQVCASPELGWR